MSSEIETIIIDSVTAWGKHFGVDTNCVNKEQKHPIWQQIFGLLTKLHLDNQELREQKETQAKVLEGFFLACDNSEPPQLWVWRGEPGDETAEPWQKIEF